MAYQKLQAGRAISVIPSDEVDIPNPATFIISGVTSSTGTNLLIDATKDFIALGVNIGDIVYSYDNTIAAYVTSVSATQLGISTDIYSLTIADYFLYANVNREASVLYVGSTGTLDVETAGGDTVVFNSVPDGSFLPIQVKKVRVSNTTAGKILALW